MFIGKLSSLALLEFVLKVQCLKGKNILEARGAGREEDREEINRLLQDKKELEEDIEMLRSYRRREETQRPSKEIKVNLFDYYMRISVSVFHLIGIEACDTEFGARLDG